MYVVGMWRGPGRARQGSEGQRVQLLYRSQWDIGGASCSRELAGVDTGVVCNSYTRAFHTKNAPRMAMNFAYDWMLTSPQSSYFK